MKYLIIAVFIFSVAGYAKAECSDKELKTIKECYSKFQKAAQNVYHAFIAANENQFCEIYNGHQKCLLNGPKCFFDASAKEMTKLLDKHIFANTTDISQVVLIEYAFKCVCAEKYAPSKKDDECFAIENKECECPKICKSFTEFPACVQKVKVNKCKNEDLTKMHDADGTGTALRNILTKC